MQILVVEDDPHNRALIMRRLVRWGYQTSGAPDGEAALEAVAAARPGLILLDIALPGISGVEVMRRLQAHASTRTIPVIAVTSDETKRAECTALGSKAFLVKPIDFAFLLAVISTLTPAAPGV